MNAVVDASAQAGESAESPAPDIDDVPVEPETALPEMAPAPQTQTVPPA